ncbi:MAG: hypothetical protein ACE5K7_02085 [Phycisphaerae bacterium]
MLATALSLALAPVALNGLWHLTHQRWLSLAAWWAGLILLTWLPPRPAGAIDPLPPLLEHRRTRLAALVLAAWVGLCIGLTYWPTELLGWPVPAGQHDFVKHHAVLDSLQRRPLPLGNVFYARGADGPIYYYHFFYLVPATLRLWVQHRLSIELAFAVQSALTALIVVGLIYLLAKRLSGAELSAMFAAFSASVIGGLDIVPVLINAARGQLVITLDAWTLDHRIGNFYTQMLWAPQHVAGLLVVLVAVAMLSLAASGRRWLLLGPLLIAAVVGTSVYVAMPALLGLGLWVLLDLWRLLRDRRALCRRAAVYIFAAGLALLLAGPLLLGYYRMSLRFGATFSTQWPRFNYALLGRLVEPGILANLLDLPWILLLEFGARFVLCLLVAGAVYVRFWRDPGLKLLGLTGLAGLAGYVCLRSVIQYNDFGTRAMLPAMAASAILAAAALRAGAGSFSWYNPLGWTLEPARLVGYRRALQLIVGATVAAGLAVGVYEAPANAVRRYAQPWWQNRQASALRRQQLADEQQACSFLRHGLPLRAVVQFHPGGTGRCPRKYLVQVARRQCGVLDPDDEDVMVFRPADLPTMRQIYADVLEAGRTSSASRAYRLLAGAGITHVFVGSVEREAWQHLEKFEDARFFRPVFVRRYAAVYALR